MRQLLSDRDPAVREIVQRCEQIELEPLDSALEAYLTHKLARAGIKLADVMEADAIDAIRARLIHVPPGGKPSDARSICYPLVVHNLVARAFNAAADVGYAKVDAQVIVGADHAALSPHHRPALRRAPRARGPVPRQRHCRRARDRPLPVGAAHRRAPAHHRAAHRHALPGA